MTEAKVIFVTGYAGSGKDEVGKIFQEKGYKRYGFADMVKIHSADRHGFPFTLTQTQEGKDTVVTSKFSHKTASVRSFLIEDSADIKIQYNDNAIIAKILAKLIEEDGSPPKIIITDWRYEAELEHFSIIYKITTIRICRNSIVPSTDPSEHNIDHIKCDYTIANDTTLDDLKQQVLQLPI